MQIQVNTDHTIEGHGEALAARIRGVVENALSRVSDHITRVEVAPDRRERPEEPQE